MLQLISSVLEKERINTWRINKTESQRAELYFIKKDLDIPRFTKISEYKITLFRDFEENNQKFRGMTVFFVEDGQTEKQISEKIRNAYFAAKFVKNPYYDLPASCSEEPKLSISDLAGRNLIDIANAYADAAFSVPSDSEAFINSLEIFASRSYVTIISSDGINVSYEENKVYGEFVTQCVRPVDVEQFRQFSYDSFDTDALKNLITSAIRDVRLRANVSGIPKSGKCNILLTGENMKAFFNYYTMRGNAAIIFPGYSTWKKGDCIQKAGSGENLNIDLLATKPYSDDGIPMKNLPYIEKGILKNISGPTRFMRYLNEVPKGIYNKINVKNGTIPFSQMIMNGTLETISFSDFQCDFFTGNFGGEMRLALLHQNDKSIPLSGGSVNAKLSDCEDRLIFSEERYEDSEYSGPYAVLIQDATIAGE